MKLLSLLLLSTGLGLAQYDAYQGNLSLNSPTGSTGAWKVERYTIGSIQRWLITTPAGHGFWCGAQYAVSIPSGIGNGTGALNSAGVAKYGTKTNWEKAVLARYAGWGFNCMAEYADSPLLNDMSSGAISGAVKVPYWLNSHFVLYSVYRENFGQTLPADEVKDFNALIAVSIPYMHTAADGFDPNMGTFIGNDIDHALAFPGGDPYNISLASPYMIGVWAEDGDFQWGFGPSPDDCASIDGVYHGNLGWVALVAPMNAYIQWHDTGNVYSTTNWVFNTTTEYSKQNLISFLKTKYANSITALNTAWGSSYTAFDSSATRFTGETIGTTDGTTTTFNYTLAHTSGVSPGTVVIKASGAVVGTDVPQSPGTIIGRWPDGSTEVQGTINYSTGSVSISAQTSAVFQQTSSGSTSWGSVSLGQTNIVPGSIVVRRLPSPSEDCRLADDATTHGILGTQQETCSPAYTVSGTINYATGVISSLTITPALTTSEGISIGFNWNKPIPNSCTGGASPCTITIDYDTNGWGVGTSLADENGKYAGHTWLGDYVLAKPGNAAGYSPVASLGAWTDLNLWLFNYTDSYMTQSVDVIKTKVPNALTSQGSGGHHGCPNKQMVLAISAHTDVLDVGQQNQTMVDLINAWGLTNRPIIDSWNGIGAQLDSPGQSVGWDNVASDNYPTQNARGAAMASIISNDLVRRGAGNPIYQNVGTKFWAHNDTDGSSVTTNSNYGFVTPSDNAYDGHENVSGSVACSAPINAYICGGETYTWAAGSNGDAITPVRAANAAIWPTILSGGSTAMPKSTIGGKVSVRGRVIVK